MSRDAATELSHSVNSEARARYPQVAKLLGISSLISTLAPRLALRAGTPYPYAFTEDTRLYPDGDNVFGRVIKRGRREGLKEIHSTISRPQNEHKWLFIPQESLWVDTTLEADDIYVDSDQFAHIFLSHIFSEIESVHTHPDTTVKKLSQTNSWEYSDNYLLEAARPSSSDIVAHSQMVTRTAPESLQVSSIVSHYGVTSFEIAKDASGSAALRVKMYEWLIDDAAKPVPAIHALLGRLGEHVLHHDETPAISVDFEPLV
jgi:hypothetical protein